MAIVACGSVASNPGVFRRCPFGLAGISGHRTNQNQPAKSAIAAHPAGFGCVYCFPASPPAADIAHAAGVRSLVVIEHSLVVSPKQQEFNRKSALLRQIGFYLRLCRTKYTNRLDQAIPGSKDKQQRLLRGIKTDRMTVFDRIDPRSRIAGANILFGLLTVPILGLGLLLLLPGLLLLAGRGDHRRFFGLEEGGVPSAFAAQAARI